MPSASTKSEKSGSIDLTDPLKQVTLVLDKKTRNLEKRKTKLDSYKSMSVEGKQLNEDQKNAVNKYDEVITQLELVKDLTKTFNAISLDHQKAIKKQARKETIEKQQQNILKMKNILIFQNILKALGSDNVRADLLAGSNGAPQLSHEVLGQMDKVYEYLSITDDDDFAVQDDKLVTAAEHLNNLSDGKPKEILGTTYKDLKDTFFMLNGSSYFNRSISEAKLPPNDDKSCEETTPEKLPQSDVSEPSPAENDDISQLQSAAVPNTDSSYYLTTSNSAPPTNPIGEVTSTVAEINNSKQADSSNYGKNTLNFLQDSQIEVNSSHVDPAIVAAHPMVPPSHSTSYIVNNQNAAQGNPGSRTMTPVSQTTAADFNQSIPSQTFTNQNFVNMSINQNISDRTHSNVGAQLPQQMPAFIPQMSGFQTLQTVSATPSVDTTPNPPPPIPLPPRSQSDEATKVYQMTGNPGFNQNTYSNSATFNASLPNANFSVQSSSTNPNSSSPTSFLPNNQTGSGDGFTSNSNVRDSFGAPQTYGANASNYASRVGGGKSDVGGSYRASQPSYSDANHCDGDKTSQSNDEWQSDIPTSNFVSTNAPKSNFNSGAPRGKGRGPMSNGIGGRGGSKGSYQNGRNYGGYFKDRGDKENYPKDNFGGSFSSGGPRRGASRSRDGYRGSRGSGRSSNYRGGQQARN